MWCVAKKVDWHLCLLKSITWTTKHGQIQNTPLQSAAVLFFNPMSSAPLMPVWYNKTAGYKPNKNLLWFNSQKFGQGWIYILVASYFKNGFIFLLFNGSEFETNLVYS